jgi:4-amino-4-deoxy-L-arabinose transferase-like glycosyltransferase
MAEITSDVALTTESDQRRQATRGLAAFAVLFTALHFYMAANVGLSNDEAYYRLWSLHPALSYFDHPPMIAWIIAAGRSLVGDTPLGIRFGTVVLYLVGGLALFRTARLLYGVELAVVSCWIALAMPLLAVGGILASPDTPSVLFWILTVWALAELQQSQNGVWWLAVGLFAGCGLLSKYTNVFLGASILLWLVAVPSNVKWLRSPLPWIAGLIAALLATPVIIWNFEHDWASFSKQFGRVAQSSASNGHFEIELVLTSLGLASPVIAVLAITGLYAVVRSAIARRGSSDILVGAVVLPMLAYFVIHALHDRVHFNWLAPLYPFLAICAARALDLQVPEHRRRPLYLSAITMGFVFTAVIFAHALQPLSGSLKSDALGETRGWKNFSSVVDGVRRQEGAAWIATSYFATNAQFSYFLKERVPVAQLNDNIRYVDMPPLALEIRKQPALYVELAARADADLLRQQFGRVTPLAPVWRADGTLSGAQYVVYLVSDPIAP